VEFPPVDAALYWALSIVPLCRRIIAKEKVDVIFTTSFPYSDHVAGLLLKRLTGRPWVADFRDPWTQNAAAGNRGWRRRLDRWVERRVLRHADRVVGVTPTYTEGLRSLAPDRQSVDFATIENGFDRDDFGTPGGDRPRDGRITVAHVGMVYDGTALPVLEALAQMGTEAAGLRLLFVGGLAPSEVGWLEDREVAARIEVRARVPHAQAIDAMRAADVLLLPVGVGPQWQGHYPGKLFEYMASGTPILMVGLEGDAAALVRASGTGCFVPAQDGGAIRQTLALLAGSPEQFRSRFYHPRPEVIARYERRALTGRLAAVFDELVRKETCG
jgi:glycosyltransferase involved in cell wall biosynthesis